MNDKSFPVVMAKLPPCSDLWMKARNAAKGKKRAKGKMVYVTLDHRALSQKYLEGGGAFPLQKELGCCLVCGHWNVDEPIKENRAAGRRNFDKMETYKRKVAEHTAQKNAGVAVGRAPPRPKIEDVYLQCHCHQMQCIRGGGGTCIECNADPLPSTAEALVDMKSASALVMRHIRFVVVCLWIWLGLWL